MKKSLPSHEELSLLAKENPEKLEALRTEWVEDLIQAAPENLQRRLRGIQFQIDCKRKLHDNPLGCCIEISKMMYESLNHLNQLMNGGLEQENAPKKATVLAFPSAS